MTAARRIAKYALLSLFAALWVGIPIWLVVVNSFKTSGEAADLTIALPETWNAVENYARVLVDGDYPRALLNSVVLVVPTMLAVLLLGAAASWAFARAPSRLLQAGYYVIVLSILVPPSIIPTITMLRELQLDGTGWGYVLTMIATRMGIAVFLATGFVKALPSDLEDAASIDGANRLQVFAFVILPLLRPVLFVGAIILVINVWGDFFFAQFLLRGSDGATLPLALFSFANSSAQSLRWNLVFAHVVMTSLPLVVAYAFVQRRVMGGLTEGALKG